MVFVFPILLGGLVLAGVPVLLHLIVRHRPKTLPFPAFRFLVQKRHSNVRKLRLRQLLLMALRVGLIAALALALARPRLFQQGLGLSSERPVAAVLVFDTSASMDYRSSDGVSRLEDAKKRGQELLDELPEGSRVAVLDSADPATAKDPWQAPANARKRIASLKLRPANAAVTAAVGEGYRLLADIARTRDDSKAYRFARLLCVLSDRTRACWDGSRYDELVKAGEQIPPLYEGLQTARGQLTPLRELLVEHGEQSLAEALGALQTELRGVTPDQPPAGDTLPAVRKQARDLLQRLDASDSSTERLRTALREFLRATAGAQALFVDVGMEQPVDLAIVQVELPRGALGQPRQLFSEGDTVELQAVVRATGKDVPVKLVWQIGETQQEVRFEARAGQAETIPVSIRTGELKLSPGPHAVELRAEPVDDLLPFDNRRFVTFAIRRKPRVLVVTDSAARSAPFARALEALEYAADVKAPADAAALAGYQAVYLVGVAAPDAALWQRLTDYARGGGSLGVVPAGDETSPDAYNQPAAQALLPGRFGKKLAGTADVGSPWDWAGGDYAHPFLRRFEAWKNNPRTSFIRYPRGAFFYWDVEPRPVETQVVIPYADKLGRPAVLARRPDPKSELRGKVLLFTTPLDRREPAWNNYLEDVGVSFYLGTVLQATSYLCGEADEPNLNFTLGQRVAVRLPAVPRPPAYVLRGPDVLETLNPAGRDLEITAVQGPGNFVVEGRATEKEQGRRLAGFSMNVAPAESDLTKVPAAEIERLFGGGAVVPLERGTKVRQALEGYWSEPVELLPYVLLLLLLLLAFENLLANKFYRQEPA